MAPSPAWTSSDASAESAPAASSQKTQPVYSSACWMYSRRHGAQSGFVMGRFYQPSCVDGPLPPTLATR